MTANRGTLPVAALTLIVGWMAVSGQSLWIDEAHAAAKAMEPTWADFLDRMALERGSDAQMPLYMGLVWAWEKLAGSSEFALRALNIPLWVLAVSAFWRWSPGSLRLRIFWTGLTWTSPFLWLYLDEIRPYILQFTGAAFILTAFSMVCDPERSKERCLREWILFWLGMVILCGASLTGVVFGFFFALAWVLLTWRDWSVLPLPKRVSLAAIGVGVAIVMVPLGLYYLQTLTSGAGASSVGRTTPTTLAFAGYEFLGFSGWGPSRIALRSEPLPALRAYAPGLAFVSLIWGAVLVSVIRSLQVGPPKPERGFWLVAASCAAGGAVLILVGLLGGFRVVGRHFMPLVPFLLWLVAAACDRLWGSRRTRWLPGALLAVSLMSGLFLRFHPRHAKDDYRRAAERARNTDGVVWWAADSVAAEYYGVDDRVIALQSPSPEALLSLPAPDRVFLSKPDIYDAGHAVMAYLMQQGYRVSDRFPAFTVWEPRSS